MDLEMSYTKNSKSAVEAKNAGVELRMTAPETILLPQLLAKTSSYVEFGAGGITVLASEMVASSVISVKPSQTWIDLVRVRCIEAHSDITPQMVHIDIGPTTEWSYPAGEQSRCLWPNYHKCLWGISNAADGDLFLVDGRFRVACTMQILAHCKTDVLIAIHDYANRAYYHCVTAVCRDIIRVDQLSLFVRRNDTARNAIEELLETHYYDYH